MFKLPFTFVKPAYLTAHTVIPVTLICVLLYVLLPERHIDQPAGMLAAEKPALTLLGKTAPFEVKGYAVTLLANYDLTARVLDKAIYHWGQGADIAPVDLVLGWKDMSNSAILRYFKFHVSNRWYTWRTDELPMDEAEINLDLDNNHLIPSTEAIDQQLKAVRVGRVVHIKGYLVSLDGKDGGNWHSSLSIGSTGGPMSCKLIYVMSFEVVQ